MDHANKVYNYYYKIIIIMIRHAILVDKIVKSVKIILENVINVKLVILYKIKFVRSARIIVLFVNIPIRSFVISV